MTSSCDDAQNRSRSKERSNRLRWQCRRGMKELDALLTGYLEEHYDSASDSEKGAFQDILALPDPELFGYLLQRRKPESEPIARVIERILGRTSS